VPFQQGAVNLIAGKANRAAYSEKWNDPALPPINDGACRNPEVITDLLAQSGGRPRTLGDLFTSIQLGLSKLKLADIKAAVSKPSAAPLQLGAPRRRNGLKKSAH